MHEMSNTEEDIPYIMFIFEIRIAYIYLAHIPLFIYPLINKPHLLSL